MPELSELSRMSAVILCGGRSRRMGRDKAGLLWDGTNFLSHLEDNLKGFGEILVSAGDRTVPGTNLKQVRDILPDMGPVGGIYSAMAAAKYSAIFIAACDTPMVDVYIASELLARAEGEWDAVVPIEKSGRIHPMCSFWKKRAGETLRQCLADRELSIRCALEKLKVCYVPTDAIAGGAQKLVNINTPEEYRAFLRSREK